jgi:hypothetical protein
MMYFLSYVKFYMVANRDGSILYDLSQLLKGLQLSVPFLSIIYYISVVLWETFILPNPLLL